MYSEDAATISTELEPGEQLLWCGRPGKLLPPGTVFLTLFFVFWTSFPAIAIANNGIGWNASIAPLALFLFGCLGLTTVLFIRPRGHAMMRYGVTDRRVLIVYRSFQHRIEAYQLHGMSAANVVLKDLGAGCGTVGFADFAQRCGYGKDEVCMPEFASIPDAIAVAELIRRTINRRKRPRFSEFPPA